MYIGKVEDTPWVTDDSLDDDELESIPEEVIQILGFDPEAES